MQTGDILNQLYILGELSIYLGLFIVLVALALALFSLAAKWKAEALEREVHAMGNWYSYGQHIDHNERSVNGGYTPPERAAEYFDV